MVLVQGQTNTPTEHNKEHVSALVSCAHVAIEKAQSKSVGKTQVFNMRKIDSHFTLHTKINSRWFKVLNAEDKSL